MKRGRKPTEWERSFCVDSESGCWNWILAKNTEGYGNAYVKGKTMKAHRHSWARTFGSIPAGMCVLHKCDNRACVNPSHLFLGTLRDNSNDMVKKGRATAAKLTPEQILEIRSRRGESSRRLSKQFGVHRSTISRVLNRDSWIAL